MLTPRLRIIVLILLTLAAVAGLILTGHPWLALAAALVGALWLVEDWRAPEGRPLLDTLGLFVFTLLAALGIGMGLPGWLGLAIVLLALAGWDLSRFGHRLVEVVTLPPPPAWIDEPADGEATSFEPEEEPTAPAGQTLPAANPAARRLERTHLLRLGLALGAGLVLGGLALLVRITLDFGVALVLGILAVILLSQIIRRINRVP